MKEILRARSGHRVIWLGNSQTECHAQLETDATNTSEVSRITRTAGREEIRYQSGGIIRYISIRSHGHRGMAADAISVTPSMNDNTDLMCALIPCLATSTHGEVIIR